MAFSPGYKAFIMIDGVNGAGTNVSQYADNFTFPNPTDVLDVSAFGTAAKANIPGLTGGGVVGLSGPLDTAFGLIIAQVNAAQVAGSTTSTILYGPAGSVASALKQSAEAWVTDFTVTTGVGGRAEYSASLQITGAVAISTF